MILTVQTIPTGLTLTTQDIIAILQVFIAALLGLLALFTYIKDKSKIHMEMYDAIERLQILYVEKVKCEIGSHEEKILNNIKEQMCNRYEILCYEYFKRRISRRAFKDMYFLSIVQHVEDKNFSDFYCPSGKYNCYDYTIKVYLIAKKEVKN